MQQCRAAGRPKQNIYIWQAELVFEHCFTQFQHWIQASPGALLCAPTTWASKRGASR
jgi:hypothetical protein